MRHDHISGLKELYDLQWHQVELAPGLACMFGVANGARPVSSEEGNWDLRPLPTPFCTAPVQPSRPPRPGRRVEFDLIRLKAPATALVF